MRTTTTRTRGARTALVIGSAFAAPMAVVGVANAVSPAPTPPGTPASADLDATSTVPESRALPDPGRSAAEASLPEADIDAAQAFWDHGYRYCDAEALAAAHGTDVWEAKLSVGRVLVRGASVAPPSGCADEIDGVAAADAAALEAFWAAGYQYCDAEALAASIGVGGPYETKIAIGTALVSDTPLVSGADLPAPTGCSN